MLTFGVRAHDMDKVPFAELIQDIHKREVECIQLALKKSITEFNVSNEALTPGLAAYMKNILDNNHVNIAVLGCYLNLATPDKIQLEKNIETYKANIRFAKYLGCGMVGTETGALNTKYEFSPENHSDKALEIFIHNLRDIVTYAEKLGVIIGIEPVVTHIVSTVERAKAVLDTIDSPNLQIIFDPVNLISVDNYKVQEQMMVDAFDLIGQEISVIHMKDFLIEGNEKKKAPIGKGMFKLEKLLSLLKEHKPYIQILMEDIEPSYINEARGYIMDVFHNIRETS